MADERDDEALIQKARHTTERMANECSVAMNLWNEHSNAVLDVCARLAEAEGLRAKLARQTAVSAGMQAVSDQWRERAEAAEAKVALLERENSGMKWRLTGPAIAPNVPPFVF